MEQPVKNGCCSKLSGKQFVPSAYWQIGRNNEGAFFVSLTDDLKKQALSLDGWT